MELWVYFKGLESQSMGNIVYQTFWFQAADPFEKKNPNLHAKLIDFLRKHWKFV